MTTGPILRRLGGSLVAIFLSSVAVFVIFFVMPGGDPAARIAGRQATPEVIASVRVSYGFDRPVYDQYLTMMHKLVTNQLVSYTNHTRVVSEMASRFPATLSLAIGAIIIGAALTIVSGLIGAIYRNRLPGAAVAVVSMVIVSLPIIFVVALLQTAGEFESRCLARWGLRPNYLQRDRVVSTHAYAVVRPLSRHFCLWRSPSDGEPHRCARPSVREDGTSEGRVGNSHLAKARIAQRDPPDRDDPGVGVCRSACRSDSCRVALQYSWQRTVRG